MELDRDDVVAMLAGFGTQAPRDVPDQIDSLELAWLLHQAEQRYGVRVDDGQVGRMDTVSGAVDVLREAIAARASETEGNSTKGTDDELLRH